MDGEAARFETLAAFMEAYNRHDVDGILALMTGDCVFEAHSGPEACGSRYAGRDAVRRRVEAGLRAFPDARWVGGRHVVFGERGISEWTFEGTRAADGRAMRVNGCDLFTFRGTSIHIKSTYQKAYAAQDLVVEAPQAGTAHIRVSVHYPRLPEAPAFDHAYYRDRHRPLVRAVFGRLGMLRSDWDEIRLQLGAETPGLHAVGHQEWPSEEVMRRAYASPEAAGVRDDVKNFYGGQAVIFISEIHG